MPDDIISNKTRVSTKLWYNRGMKRHAVALAAAVAALCASGAKRPFDLYQSVIDRYPFGEGPEDPGVPPENARDGAGRGADGVDDLMATPEQEQLEKSVSLSVINITPDGRMMAGFSDMTDPKAPRHYYVAKGETKGGWTVKDIDPIEKKAVLSKDGVEIERYLGEAASGSGKGAAARGPGINNLGHREGLMRAGRNAGLPVAAAGGGPLRSHRALKRERDEAARKERQEMADAMRKRQAEDEARREQENLERAAEREEMRKNLMDMQEQLRKVREENKLQHRSGDGNGDDNA